MRRKNMKEYRKAGVHHAEFYRGQGVVEWGVYKWMMRRARGQEARARWDKRMRNMWKECIAQWGITRKKPRSRRRAGAVHGKVLHRGERDNARTGILLCAPLGLKGPRGKIQSTSGQWYDVHADMSRRDNFPGGGRTGRPVLKMHQGGKEDTVDGPQNDGTGVPDPDHSHYGRQGTVVGAGATAAQGGAGGQGGPGGY